ncbi:MAG: ubiquinone biosynthesis regulatory protein kinase UbiB [Gammaproteobacteria bacterium]|nr:ubiquinone biosynthesis regulatory protein kinase UbiB [Gammaproteobacteria bacterium]
MIRPAEALRLVHINRILFRHGLDEVILATHLFRPLRFLYFVAPWHWFRRKQGPRAERIRKALEDLGPIFVKLGQIISTRRDLLPQDIADELALLQDQVAPFPTKQARKIIEQSLGCSIAEVFTQFDEKPLASASVAQVYGATLHDGRNVVVKVIRPNIIKTIERDTGLMQLIADLGERYSVEARRLRPTQLVSDFKRTVFDELDLVREAANASQLRRNFEKSELLHVPEVYWQWTSKQVMVMERISGVPIDDIRQLASHKVNMQKLAERGVEIFFKQVFVDNFFHADMHPGNIFVDVLNPENPRYIAVDFGIVGTLSDEDKRYLAKNFLAFFNRDYRRVAQLHLDSGWVPAHVHVGDLETAIRTVCEPNFSRPLKEISFGQILVRLFQTVRRFDFVIQPQLVLLQKTLLNIEGIGRQLYPDLDLWSTAKPFMEKAMREEVLLDTLISKLPGEKPEWLRRLPDLPGYIEKIVRDAAQGRLSVRLQAQELRQFQKVLKQGNRRNFFTTVGAALLICASVIYGLDGYQPDIIYGAPFPSWLLGVSGIGLIFLSWFRD